MSFIDYINITFEEIVNNICENNEFIIDITHLESNVITLFKETKYNLNFNDKHNIHIYIFEWKPIVENTQVVFNQFEDSEITMFDMYICGYALFPFNYLSWKG